ncbi:MAG: MASE3 domain-containing protein, partial [Candidatus Omnitrophica bacterium]|nr:MASE3 domain-containing protein [Candidatus Omnitrophota bacterium]
GVFMFAWNSREFFADSYFLFLGIAYLFVAALDILHLFAFRSMGVFHGVNSNLPHQLWIISRYTQSISLCIAPYFFTRKLRGHGIFLIYTAVIFLFLLSIFYWKNFPACYIDGKGVTWFKTFSEILICSFFAAAVIRLFYHKKKLDRRIFQMMVWVIAISIASELFFMIFPYSYGWADFSGHILKVISFYLFYRAVIETGFKHPYQLLFRDLKLSQENLLREKNRAKNYLDVSGGIITVLDADGTILLINKQGCRMSGYAEAELIGKNYFDIFIPLDQRGEWKLFFRKFLRGEIPISQEFETPFLTRSGAEKIIMWSSTVLKDEYGCSISVLSSGNDMTEYRQKEAALQYSEKKYRNFVDNAPAGIYQTHFDGYFVYANDALARMFEFDSAEEMMKEKIAQRYKNIKDREVLLRRLKRYDQVTGYEVEMITKTGRVINIILNAIREEDTLTGMMMDITVLKQAEAILKRDKKVIEQIVNERTQELVTMQKELNDAKRLSDIGKLAAMVAHELRTPLGVIRTAAYNVKRKANNPLLDSHLFNIEKNIIESDQIIRSLLYYSHIRMPEYQSVHVYDLLSECISTARNTFQYVAVDINEKFQDVKGLPIEADPLQLKEVLHNILFNALESLSEGKGAVEVSAWYDAVKDEMNMRFKDNGVGIETEDLKKLSEPFFTTKARGTGLGLSICYNIIDLHGGRIDVDSVRGKGTTFTVVLPSRKRSV